MTTAQLNWGVQKGVRDSGYKETQSENIAILSKTDDEISLVSEPSGVGC